MLHWLGDQAFGKYQYVGQESLVTADQIVALARSAGARPGARLLDLCCGAGGAALYLARATGCRVIGLDRDAVAIHLARVAAARGRLGQQAVFVVGQALAIPLRSGGVDAAILLETMLAIRDKATLLGEVRRLLRPGGCFGLTLEAGLPLSARERAGLPESEDIWLVPEAAMLRTLAEAGFSVRHVDDLTIQHAAVAGRLAALLERARPAVASLVGAAQAHVMMAAHRRWAEWLGSRRVRKLAIVAQRMT